jgi:transposase-like protein
MIKKNISKVSERRYVPPSIRTRGDEIARLPDQIRRIDGWHYRVRSQSQPVWYNISWRKRFWACECPFNRKTHQTCKHIYAILQRLSEVHNDSELAVCGNCGKSSTVVRRGFYETKSGRVQRYGCRRCISRFTVRTGFTGMKYSARIITAALDLYFKGLSLRSVADHLNQAYGLHISHLSVYRWVRRYIPLIVSYTQAKKPRIVSQTWHADEMRINVNGNLRNLWNLMDHRTRFLLAVQVTKRKGSYEAKRLVRDGLKSGTKRSVGLISDGLASYSQAVRALNAEGAQISHFPDRGLSKHKNNNRLERLNGSVRQRLKTMRGLDNDNSSRMFVKGFAAYYNYVRPHAALGGRTPAQAAGIERLDQKNKWISLIRRAKRDSERAQT